MAHFFLMPMAVAQSNPTADDMGGVDLTGLVVHTRTLDSHYPVSGNAHLFVSNQFGAIRVSTWDNPLINMKAIIRVGAENEMKAKRFAQSISVEGSHVDDRVALRTVYPKVEDPASLGYTVELQISVPPSIAVTTRNRFGDTSITGVQGAVVVDSSYGAVDLSRLGAHAQVRAKGEFPLTVNGLPQGGTFFLRSTKAALVDIGGTVTVNNYLGSISLDQLHDTAEVSATSDNGPIRLILPPAAKPQLHAAVEFGNIESDIPVQLQRWGKKTLATLDAPESQQRIELDASFGTILIQHQSLEPLTESPGAGARDAVQEVVQASIPFAEGQSLLVDAMAGNVHLEATDLVTEVQLEATRFVRVNDVANARAAMDSLVWVTDDSGTETRLRTSFEGDPEALGMTDFKMHLHIKYPKSAKVNIVHSAGATKVNGAVGDVTIEQKDGNILVAQAAGTIDIESGSGNVLIRESSGTVIVASEAGTVRTEQTSGALRLECRRGHIVIDTPRSSVFARNEQGEISIVALEGVFGDFDVMATNGNISMVIPPTSDALLLLNAEDGRVYSSFPVTGTLEKQTQAFQGRLNAATHRILLETRNGDIDLD